MKLRLTTNFDAETLDDGVSILIEMPSSVAIGADLSRTSDDLGVRFELCRGDADKVGVGGLDIVRVVERIRRGELGN